MKHHFRQKVINEFGLPVTKNFTVDGELGSGIFDKNGKEIFEGDRVSVISREGIHYGVHTVIWRENDGTFWADESFPLGNAAYAKHNIRIIESTED